MAEFCPCGCGRKLSLAERGMGKQACTVGDRIKFLEQYTLPLNMEPEEDLDLEPREDLESFIEEGRGISDNLIAVVHGELPANAFERGSLNNWLKAAQAMELNTKAALEETQEKT